SLPDALPILAVTAKARDMATSTSTPINDFAVAAGDPFAGDVTPEAVGSHWRFTLGNTVFEVDPTNGASIPTFARNGHNVLAMRSWFRPSPQSRWSWPPPPEI